MNIPHIYAPAIGVPIYLDTTQYDDLGNPVGGDLTGNTGLQAIFNGPNGLTFTRAGTLSGSRIVEYIVAAGDFDPSNVNIFGDWTVYATAAFGGSPLAGDPVGFQVRQAGVRAR